MQEDLHAPGGAAPVGPPSPKEAERDSAPSRGATPDSAPEGTRTGRSGGAKRDGLPAGDAEAIDEAAYGLDGE